MSAAGVLRGLALQADLLPSEGSAGLAQTWQRVVISLKRLTTLLLLQVT